MRSTVCSWISAFIVLAWAATLHADGTNSPAAVYTNIAGQVISGPVQGVADGKATFAGRAYPLRIFPEGEQRRILMDAKVALPPRRDGSCERTDLFYKNRLDRLDVLERQGAISREKAVSQRQLIQRAWRLAREKKRDETASPKSVPLRSEKN